MLRNLLRLSPFALAASVAFTGLACSGEAADDGGEVDDGALVGGVDSGSADDAVVSLFRRGEPHCAATVIAPNVLLTALHCVAEVDNDGNIGAKLQPYELTVHMGTKPATQRAATVSRIVMPDGVENASTPVRLQSNDIAAIYVQPVDPAFAKITPRQIARQPYVGDQVSVVGYTEVARDPFGIFTQLRRQRRDNVYVWAGANDRSLIQAVLEDGRAYYWRNRPSELTTELVACGSDSGGPAFDLQGNLVGIVVGVVGECVPGSLSVFTDVGSQTAFIQKVVGGTGQMCLSDAQCGSVSSGRVCDAKTNRCVKGCRAGGTQCIAGQTCSAQNLAVGNIGICRSKSGPLDASDPMYDEGPYAPPENVQCPGHPLCPTGPTARECSTDAQCAPLQTGGKARICDIPRGRCLEGCRVGVPNACGSNQACGASQDDPAIGLCQVANTPPVAPGSPPAAPPTYPSQPPAAGTSADTVVGAGYETTSEDGGTTTKKKKKKNKAQGDAACSVSMTGNGNPVAALPIGLALAGLAMRRRRKA